MSSNFDFPEGTELPPQIGVCRFCGHYLASSDMGNGLVALIASYGADGYYPEHACGWPNNPGVTHEVRP